MNNGIMELSENNVKIKGDKTMRGERCTYRPTAGVLERSLL